MDEKTIAIITARGGSKRIPHKNIKEFCGKPIIEYSIEAAIKSGVFNEVMVSTDDEEIAKIAVKAGATVPFMRSAKTADDFSTTSDVLKEVLDMYKQQGNQFSYACCLYPTAPFVTGEKLKSAMNMLLTSRADTVMTVVPFSFPPQRGMVIRENKLEVLHQEFQNSRSQDLETIYHDCGQFYCFEVCSFLQTNQLMGKNVLPIVLDELEVQDIDNLVDWRLAELKYELIHEGKCKNEGKK